MKSADESSPGINIHSKPELTGGNGYDEQILKPTLFDAVVGEENLLFLDDRSSTRKDVVLYAPPLITLFVEDTLSFHSQTFPD